MCNLYDIGPVRGVKGRGIQRLVIEKLSELTKEYGIRKTDPGVVVRRGAESSGWEAVVMRWGFSRPFNPAINNARMEKLAEGMWRPAREAGRWCLVPVATFYEWSGPKRGKQTHAFQAEHKDQLLWMAGLWEEDPEVGLSYTMITRAAEGVVAEIHDRMPAILAEDRAQEFLERDSGSKDEMLEWLSQSCLAEELRSFRCLNPLKSAKPGPPVEDPWLL